MDTIREQSKISGHLLSYLFDWGNDSIIYISYINLISNMILNYCSNNSLDISLHFYIISKFYIEIH